MVKKLAFILFLFLISCSGEDEEKIDYVYDFPPLSQGRLIDLKKESESIEGFFITTDLSDLDPSWAERGFYIYVCIRFLNDKEVNDKLNKSAIPLLIQVSNHKDRPEAESVLLLHPETRQSEKGIFYYEEKGEFELMDTSIVIRDMEYNIFDVEFNPKGKITRVLFIKKGTTPEELKQASSEEEENGNEDGGETMEQESKEDLILEVKDFAKQFSGSCEGWPVLNYSHSNAIPDYLNVEYKKDDSKENNKNNNNNNNNNASAPQTTVQDSQVSVPPQTLIDEDAPYNPVDND